MQFTKPVHTRCVNKLPKVGQRVSLNNYEVYFAAHKIAKPIAQNNNVTFGKWKESKVKPNKSLTPRGERSAQELDESPYIQSMKTQEDSKSNSDNESGSSSSSFVTPVKKSFFQRIGERIKSTINKGKDAETMTCPKSRLRYITFDQDRIIVLKMLRDKVDGDKFSQMREFPNFSRSMSDKDYKMPMISWNAKIVRIYKLDMLKSVKWHNYKKVMNFCRQNGADESPSEEGDESD